MFDPRATAKELLEGPDCDPALAAASYRFIETVICHFGGTRGVRRFPSGETAGHHAGVPLRIFDIGSGSCDIPLPVNRRARVRGISMHFTCLETGSHAVGIARGQLTRAGDPSVQLFHEDAFTHQPAKPYDCALASMCFHHFNNALILTLLPKLRGFVIHSVMINDPRRSRWALPAAKPLLTGTGASAGVRHDALLSIRRGFRLSEQRTVLRQLDRVTVSVEPAPWFRIAAIIRFLQ